uniref:Butyrophilin subfamily 1 member A1 n=1 Tax=Bos mutus grunniens TaxID=30521 RepID=A0A8C0AFG7_BOSMU
MSTGAFPPDTVCPLPSVCISPAVSLPSLCSQKFRVTGPLQPIVAVLGGEAVLPCSLFPAVSAEDMELRWFRSKSLEAVFAYQNRQEQKEELMAPYAGRTSLVGDRLNQGYAAVRIQRVQASDNGLYTCFFRKGHFYEEAGLELKVAGVGSAPQVRITGPEEDGVRVVCTASGWFPKPQVQWRDLSGEKFLAFSEAHTQDAEGLFSVEAALVVRDSSVGNVTCSILNPVLGREKAMAIFIPEPFFPQASPWKVAFSVSLTVLVILLLGAGCYTKREHSMKMQEMGEKETLCQTSEQDRPVTLDPGSAHSDLVVSHEKTSVTLKASCVNTADTCSVLGFEGITSGRCYWEVEIRDGDQSGWALGVCGEGVNRKGWYTESPDKGFWAVGRFERAYCACTVPQTLLSLMQAPHPRLRVGASFSGTLFPYFMIRYGDVSMTICSKVGGSEGLPVALSNPSLEEPVSLPGVGFNSGSGADGLPGAESPLLP